MTRDSVSPRGAANLVLVLLLMAPSVFSLCSPAQADSPFHKCPVDLQCSDAGGEVSCNLEVGSPCSTLVADIQTEIAVIEIDRTNPNPTMKRAVVRTINTPAKVALRATTAATADGMNSTFELAIGSVLFSRSSGEQPDLEIRAIMADKNGKVIRSARVFRIEAAGDVVFLPNHPVIYEPLLPISVRPSQDESEENPQ